MSQRSDAVTTVVRFGTEPVATMVARAGCADCVVSFETTEALRSLPFVREGAICWLLTRLSAAAIAYRQSFHACQRAREASSATLILRAIAAEVATANP